MLLAFPLMKPHNSSNSVHCLFSQTVQEAQCLASQVQLFYATDRQETYWLVESFNHKPNEFKYMSVISELEQNRIGQELRPQEDVPSSTA